MYSPKGKLFFIHVPKCAGTSIEHALLAANGVSIDKMRMISTQLSTKEKNAFIFSKTNGLSEAQHITAQQCIDKNIREFTEEALFTFAVIRNPWDRFVSEFFWRRDRVKHVGLTLEGLADMFKKEANNHCIPMWKYVMADCNNNNNNSSNSNSSNSNNNGQPLLLVDRVFRMESEMSALQIALQERLRNNNIVIQKTNISSARRKQQDRSYREYYSQSLKNTLKPLFEKDEDIFGYSF